MNDVGDRNKGNGYVAVADHAATTGDGIHIVGNGNTTITGNDVFHNAEDGVDVAGNTNNVATNNLGDSNKGNGARTACTCVGEPAQHGAVQHRVRQRR